MKNLYLICLLSFFVLFASCNQEKEELFSPKLIGTWEIVNWDESIDREIVNSFIFRTDGSYTNQWTQRVSKEDTNIGYQLLTNGVYTSTGDQLSLMPKEIFSAPFPNNGSPHGPKEELVKTDFSGTQVDRYQFSISEDNEELVLPIGSVMLYKKVK